MRNNSSSMASIGSFQLGHTTYKEKETIEKCTKESMRIGPSILLSVVGRNKYARGNGNMNF